MRWILGLLGAVVGSVAADEEGLVMGAAFGLLVGWLIERERARVELLARAKTAAHVGGPGTAEVPVQSSAQLAEARLTELTRRVEQLERQVAELRAGAAREPGRVGASAVVLDDRGWPVELPQSVPPDDRALLHVSQRELQEQLEEQAATGQSAALPPSVPPAPVAVAHAAQGVGPEPVPALAAAPRTPLFEALHSFFFGGNTVVRAGILVLTIGVGLLVKYAADADYFPLELRLAFAAALGVALVAFGFAQRSTRPSFATALQGGGVAAMYLVTFFSFHSYRLLPAALALALLVAIAALSTILAVVQNAQQLAVFGAIGGFLSPVLAASGGGSHVALFSYYAVLNLALSGSALFRSWRILNYTGFLFTFGIASAWGALKYEPENMGSASLFLTLFFLLYVANGTLFALRQPAERRGLIDTTLTFGTPLATLALAGGLFRLQHLYLALACVFIAAVYLGLARMLMARRDDALLALSRAYIAIGIGVASLAVPFALDDALGTALAWSFEASGLVWVGVRQSRLRTRVAGYLLFMGSLFALVVRQHEASVTGQTLFGALIALSLGFAAAVLEQNRAQLRDGERYLGHVLLASALLVWASAGEALIRRAAPVELRPAMWLLTIAATTGLLEGVGTLARFGAARSVATFAFPFLLLGSLDSLVHDTAPLQDLGWLGYPLAIGAAYVVLRRNEATLREHPRRADFLHASSSYLLAILAVAQLRDLTVRVLALDTGWRDAAALLAPLTVVALALWGRPSWPFGRHPRGYQAWAAWPMVLLLSALSLFVQAESHGSAAPLPYLPLLNPLDLTQALLIGLTLLLARAEAVRGPRARRIATWSAVITGFVALNATVVRTAHHWLDEPFVPYQVPSTPVVQATFSILWTVLALIAMLAAHRRAAREPWVAGAVLLAAVVVKLFFVDLSSLGGAAKIITFLAVGLLLLLIGYFAPVPPARRASSQREAEPGMSEERS